VHPTALPLEVINAVTARRGRPYAFPSIDPKRTALVVIDMQNAFVAPGSPAEVPLAREIVPNVNRLAEAVRRSGGRVVWVQTHLHPGDPGGGWPVFFGEIFSPEQSRGYITALTRGTEGHRLWAELQKAPGDLSAEKTRFSAFLPGACDLPERLLALGMDTVLIAGTLTNVCCESSARDAMMRGFRVIMVSDANATRSDSQHLATLINIHQVFGDVRATDDLMALLETGTRPHESSRHALG
jgi:ureidoacrylate peracid hydrolase